MKVYHSARVATVSSLFLDDWLEALSGICSKEQLDSFLQRAGLIDGDGQPFQRVTLDQIVWLYGIAAIETSDEMMGLWSRPVRVRALQHLLTTVRQAKSLPSALYKFSTFWNLLLDDYQFELSNDGNQYELVLNPIGDPPVQRFGHMLILKLAHGLISWMAGREVAVKAVKFAFDEPEFVEDYNVIFPTQIDFNQPHSSISFELAKHQRPVGRTDTELVEFLTRAPRDWLFTNLHENTRTLQIREILYRSTWEDCNLAYVSSELNLEPRTLMRRLKDDGTSFQEIKDGLRRDIAIRELHNGRKTIEEVSQRTGFSSAANFHIAFKRWTGTTPRLFSVSQQTLPKRFKVNY
jgi:AraC-like DNA-binding protein